MTRDTFLTMCFLGSGEHAGSMVLYIVPSGTLLQRGVFFTDILSLRDNGFGVGCHFCRYGVPACLYWSGGPPGHALFVGHGLRGFYGSIRNAVLRYFGIGGGLYSANVSHVCPDMLPCL